MKFTLTEREAKRLSEQRLKKYLTQWGNYARSNDGHFVVCSCGMDDNVSKCACSRIISKD